MAAKTANVLARVEPDVKEQAESIMNMLGVPASTVINMLEIPDAVDTKFADSFADFLRLVSAAVVVDDDIRAFFRQHEGHAFSKTS